MGKALLQQRRGKGGVFRTPGHRFLARIRYQPLVYAANASAQVIALHDDPGRSTPVAELLLPDGKRFYVLAAEGLAVGDRVAVGTGGVGVGVGVGSILPLNAIPDATPVFNLETAPRDGGRAVRSSGAAAFIVSHDEETGLVNVQLPSKQVLSLSPNCFATIGVASGGGRLEKPFMKAGAAFYAARARGHYYPRVRGTAMNAYDHPYGGKTGGKPTTVSHSTPPGRKAGHIGARSTGRKKAKRGAGPSDKGAVD